jgi:class 3 adenylate cyclase
MVPDEFTPPFVDLKQDIAGEPPRGLIDLWLSGPRTPERAEQILEPYRVTGTALSCDSAGLTRLARSLDIVEVVARLSHAKRVLHAAALAHGGAAPGGRWTADNAQLFFPASVGVEHAILAALCAHATLPAGGAQLGACLHHGRFWKIGGGLFGREAEVVEAVAEEYARGGETLLTRAVLDALADAGMWDLEPLGTVAPGLEPLWRVRRSPLPPEPVAPDESTGRYPLGFSAELFEAMIGLLDNPDQRDARLADVRLRFEKHRTIVMLELGRERSSDAAGVLDLLAAQTALADSVVELAGLEAEIVECSTEMVLAAFPDPAPALTFTRTLMRRETAMGAACRAGMDIGPVLLTHDPEQRWGIMGSPVNVASKQAHELGEVGRIYLTDELARRLGLDGPGTMRYRAEVSGVVLEGFVIEP